MSDQFWWYVARSSGMVAWAAALGSLLVGMALSTRALGPRPRGPWLLDLHRFLAGLCLGVLGLHLFALVADTFVHFGLVELLVPFASDYRPSAVAWGILAFWLLVVIETTSLAMHRLPRSTWYGIHLASYVVAVAATVHGLYAGTDSANPAFRWIALLTLGGTGFFLIYRVLAPASSRKGDATGATVARARAQAAQRQAHGPQPPDTL